MATRTDANVLFQSQFGKFCNYRAWIVKWNHSASNLNILVKKKTKRLMCLMLFKIIINSVMSVTFCKYAKVPMVSCWIIWKNIKICLHFLPFPTTEVTQAIEPFRVPHCCDVIMGALASQITSLTIVYSIVYSGPDQRKHQSSASLAFVRGMHRWPVNSPHKWPVTRKMFVFDDVIMGNHELAYRLSAAILLT